MRYLAEKWLGDYREPWGKLLVEYERNHWGLGVSVRHTKTGTRVGDPRPRRAWVFAVRIGPYTAKATRFYFGRLS